MPLPGRAWMESVRSRP